MSRIDRSLDETIRTLALAQHGLVAHHQIVPIGANRFLARSRIRSGSWQCAAPGVYLVGPTPRTFAQRCMAAVLSAGNGALLSHRAAARLWGIIPSRSVPVEVSVPRERQLRRRGVVVHRSRDLPMASPTTVDSIPITGLARTLLDLGAEAPDWVRKAVWEAQRVHGIGWDELLTTLADHGRPGRAGVGPLRHVVARHYGEIGRESRTEDLAFALLCDSGLVPTPQAQVPVLCADGVEVTADLGWPEWRVYVEIFGGHHLYNADLAHIDLHRRNQIELAGNSLLTYSGELLRRQPDQFIADVAALLWQQGCTGLGFAATARSGVIW